MSFFNFAFSYCFLLVFGTLAVTGFFVCTRGRIEYLPDGSVIKKGRIFKGWYFYWTRKQKLRDTVFYSGEPLRQLLAELHNDLLECVMPRPNVQPGVEVAEASYLHFTGIVVTRIGKLRQLEKKHGIKFSYAGYHSFRVYKCYDRFVFPEWVRQPVAECATCFASLYGSLFYWSIVPFLHAFQWSSAPCFHILFFWAAFCLALSVLNTLIAKKL